MRITFNGQESAADGTVGDLMTLRFGDSAGKGMAVAVNYVVIARGSWAETALRDGDRIDVVTAVQGG